MLSLIRRFGKVFRGGVHPLEIGVSVALGVLAGVAVGKNGLVILLFLLMLILNINKPTFSLACVPFGALGITLARYKFLAGRWILSVDPVARFFESTANAPVGAMMGFDRYAVAGGFAIGLPLAFLAGLVAALLTKKFRTAALALVGDEEAFKGWMKGRFARIGKWILFGVGEADYEASLTRMPCPIRVSGVILLAVLVLLLLVAGSLDYGLLSQPTLEKKLTQAVGAQVDVGEFSLRPLAAAARIADLAVTDRTEPSKNSIAAKTLLADFSIPGLLKLSAEVDEISISRLELGTDRAKPGEVISPEGGEEAKPEGVKIPEVPKGGEDISAYLTHWETWKQKLAKLRDTLRSIEDCRRRSVEAGRPPEGEDTRDFDSLARKYGYESFRAPKIRRTIPDLVIRKLSAEDIRTTHDYFNVVDLEIENLAYPFRFAEDLTRFRIIDKKGMGSMELVVDFRDPECPAKFNMTLSKIPAKDLNNQLGSRVPVTFEKGAVELKGSGDMRSGSIDVNLCVDLADAVLKPKKNVSIAGLRNKDLETALEMTRDLELYIGISGDPANPRVKVESDALEEALKKTVTEKAKRLLKEATEKKRKELEEEAERLRKKAKMDEVLREAAEKKKRELERLKRRREEEEKRKNEKGAEKAADEAKKGVEEDAKKKAEDTLKKIFR
jgi:uncharacterized protein (TIGR03546 family)